MDWFTETLWPDWAQKIKVKEVLFHEQTEHQDLVVFESGRWGLVLALDGVVQTTTADEFVYHEMLVHTPILAHGKVERVLIIGGGDGGCLREAVRHPGVVSVTQVEIDKGVIDFCERYLPSLSDGAFHDPRVAVVIADGAKYAASTNERYDVVIVDSTDPQGPGAVLFTEAFYHDCHNLLNEGGVMVTQCGNPAVHPAELVFTQERQRSAGFADVSYFFAAVPTYIGGSMALGWASDDPSLRLVSAEALSRRTLPANLKYYNTEVHKAAFAHPTWIKNRVGY